MAYEYVNKVILNGQTKPLIDLSSDTAEEAHVLSGYSFHLKSGKPTTGTCTYDSDTTDADARDVEILYGKIAYVNKNKITGQMVNNGAITATISTASEPYVIPVGYHDGSGTVSVDTSKLKAENIREGVNVLGVVGTMSAGEGITSQEKEVTPTFAKQTITPDENVTYLSAVVVNSIPVVYTDNSAFGQTVTIG